MQVTSSPFIDGFGRRVTYLRLSVTDRCDLRCTYCMPQHMIFSPRSSLLGVAELDRIAEAFVAGGVRKIRLTGGEPLVRKDLPELLRGLGRHVTSGRLDEIAVSTNGSQLARLAETLAGCGVTRINVSLDTLDPDQYRAITRGGELSNVLEGIEAARDAGLSIRINAVALRGVIEEQFEPLLLYAHGRGMALALIETMPLGDTGISRVGQYLSLTEFRKHLSGRWGLSVLDHKSGGPAHYVEVRQTGGLLGFITPLSCNFCASCNRVRVGSNGRLYTCLGHEGSVDLRPALASTEPEQQLDLAIRDALRRKPERHGFRIGQAGVDGIGRHMSVLGG
ncbi:MAG: cyclic pyranopterin phosphate synthase MoaA [Kaistia sp. SCN 65-12]|nr:MAG: cyclic pyranopterin phosphate synthase MoaA [Kaistia sp. SCN 65-12]